jgi:GntR family transcriptional regulator
MNRLSAHDERLPLYQRLRDDLLQRIADGEWGPGGAIPTEAELTQAYELATGTVRKAIDMLVAEGVLTRSQGKGTYVRRPNFNTSLFRFFRFKTKSGEDVQPTAKILSRAVRVPPADVRQALGMVDSDSEGIFLSRLRLIEDRPVLAEEIWLPRTGFEPLVELKPKDFGDLLYPLYESACKQLVASARERLTVEVAGRSIAERLGLSIGSPVIAVQRVAFNFAGTPIEWRCTRGSADGFQYEVDIR